ncbi:MAG: DNA-deoxyinosine glycosylase [Peptococcaceae bacterium]|nr:DNA-deoxyinosine glycosylase [Peptococcaceae bacterium]
MTPRIHSFPPIAAEGCKVLILGSMPSVTSLERHQYYGHKQNDFWPMMFAFFEQPYTDTYSVKQELLIKHGIALWDVLSSCEREGSLDSNIMNEIPNDINGLLVQYPTIEYIIFNGGKAYQSFKKYFPELLVQKQWIKMPSTSPAYTLKREEKRKKWRKILDICEINL